MNGQGKAVEGQGNAVDRSRKGSGKVEERQWKGRGKAVERPGRRQCGRPGERQCLLCHPAVLVGTLQQPFVGPAAARRHSIHPPLGLMRWSHGEIRLLTAEERGQSKGGQSKRGSRREARKREKRRRGEERHSAAASMLALPPSLCACRQQTVSLWNGRAVAWPPADEGAVVLSLRQPCQVDRSVGLHTSQQKRSETLGKAQGGDRNGVRRTSVRRRAARQKRTTRSAPWKRSERQRNEPAFVHTHEHLTDLKRRHVGRLDRVASSLWCCRGLGATDLRKRRPERPAGTRKGSERAAKGQRRAVKDDRAAAGRRAEAAHTCWFHCSGRSKSVRFSAVSVTKATVSSGRSDTWHMQHDVRHPLSLRPS